MGILGGKFKDQDDDGGGGDAVTLPLDDVVCSTCGRDLAPWMMSCPDDGGAPVARSESMTAGVPDVPAHLLDGLDAADDHDGHGADGPTPEAGPDPQARPDTRSADSSHHDPHADA